MSIKDRLEKTWSGEWKSGDHVWSLRLSPSIHVTIYGHIPEEGQYAGFLVKDGKDIRCFNKLESPERVAKSLKKEYVLLKFSGKL